MYSSYCFSKKMLMNISLYVILISIIGFSNSGSGFLYLPEVFDSFSTLLMMSSLLIAFLIAFSSQIKVNMILLMGFLFHIIIVILSLLSNKVDVFGTVYRLNVSIIPFFMIVISSYISKYEEAEEILNRILSMFTIWLSLQTIGTVLTTYYQNGILLKKEMAVSIGGSNFIAALLLVCVTYFLLLPKKENSKKHKVVFLFGFIGLVFTFSFGSIVTFILIVYLYYLTQKKATLTMVLISVFVFGIVIMLYNGLLVEMFSNTVFNDFIYKATFKIQQISLGNYDAAFAGRGAVYKSKLELITEKVILGYGTNVESAGQIRSHNWILDSLIYTGVIGTFLYLFLIGYLLIKIRKGRHLINNGNSAYFALIAGIIHGFIEPNFFSKPFDFIWWLLALVTFYSIESNDQNNRNQKFVTIQEIVK
ncbi:O-antigen ligase family protein [Clostridium sp. D2Q-14]|uniref:O-antigen ligase family protein n=1 Tax=Anaeromonas gelatinilytica TaxID=2683194 RepID=UPI00193B75AD|nr:O-antigen ligase family protein [Anaeromonas gelatinilytica]MBS4534363.1 O-antigen ligase family protein [Anaeromonas gelatinilytica]